jgi:phenylacetic acid degradation operon negative regulatory protein
VAGPSLRPRAGSSAKALLLTVLGEFVLPQGGSAWTATLVESLAVLDVEEKNARQAIARLADDGLVTGERDGRRVCWHLTPVGRELLTTGTDRIYAFGGPDGVAWDAQWLVVLCPVSEDQRAKRHHVRSRLGFAGFGFLAAGVAISPHLEREAFAAAVLDDLGLTDGAAILRAEAGTLVSDIDLLHRAWDLDGLADRYRSFIDAVGDLDPIGGREQFAALVTLVHEWRRFPFVDPEIPDALLPADWPGHRAKAVFDERHTHWSPAAVAWFAEREATNAGQGKLPTQVRRRRLRT